MCRQHRISGPASVVRRHAGDAIGSIRYDNPKGIRVRKRVPTRGHQASGTMKASAAVPSDEGGGGEGKAETKFSIDLSSP